MEFMTKRFGQINVPDEKVIHFAEGLPGLPCMRRSILIKAEETAPFYWLQSVEDGEIAIPVINPMLVDEAYAPSVEDSVFEELELETEEDLLVVNVAVLPEDLTTMTANMTAPILINIARNMIKPKPLLLLDEPTASLDAANTETVIAMIREAVARGVTQYVLLGAGLDTFAYRQPEWARAIEIVEVDQPWSQAEKRRLLEEAGIDVPANVRFAGVDFERETLEAGLLRAGVAFDRPTFFSWLGVTMYLTREAIDAVLATVGSFAKGSGIVLTFAQPSEPDEANGRFFAERAAAVGEPWISYFTPEEIEATLRSHGFSDVRFLTREAAMREYYADRRDGLLPPRRISIVSATA